MRIRLAAAAALLLVSTASLQRHHKKRSLSSDEFPFTLRRSGYETVLPYFNSSYEHSYITYKIIDQYDGVIEPYASIELTAKTTDMYESSSAVFNYTISCDSCSGTYRGYYSESSFGSSTVTIPCTPYDVYTIEVEEYTSSAGWYLQGTYSGNFLCLYVRREIRSLSEADLDATVQAMYELWSHGDEEGQSLYGSNYHNSTYFTYAHDFNAAWIEADHIHEGLGFPLQHIKLTNIFEAAMQAVDPSVSLPYWDYSIDRADGLSLSESPIFTPEIFGSLTSPLNSSWGFTYRDDGYDRGRIPDGLWASQAVDMNGKYPDLGNPFGFIRGRWNMNPSKYLTRFASLTIELPACESFYNFVDSYYDTATILYESAYSVHGNTHGAIGNVFGCDVLEPLLDDGTFESLDNLLDVCKFWIDLLKEGFRSGAIEFRDDCSVADDGTTECSVTCVDRDYIKESLMIPFMAYISGDDSVNKTIDFLCDGDGYKIFVGDHLESSSPADPSFWPIHGTVEKLIHLKFMSGILVDDDFEWPTTAVSSNYTEDGYVCNKPLCYMPEYGDDFEYYSYCCIGHYEYDQLLDFVTGDKNQGFGPTNRQILDGINAATSDYNMLYIYDSFEYDHCKTDGGGNYDIPTVVGDQYDLSSLAGEATYDDHDSVSSGLSMIQALIIFTLIVSVFFIVRIYLVSKSTGYVAIRSDDVDDDYSNKRS